MIYLLSILVFGLLLVILALWLTIAEKYLVDYGICTISINAGEREVEAEGGQSLLSGLYGNEIFIPSACGGKGSCGHCKVTAVSGAGDVLSTEKPYLTGREIRNGRRLACQVKIRQDIEIKVPEDFLNVKMFASTVESTRYLTHDIKEIRLKLSEPVEIEQRPGQYIQVLIPTPDEDVFRAYSISSPTFDNNVAEMNVRLVPGGVGSTYLHNLQEGDSVVFTGPYGEFRLNEDPDTEIICVGGGAGMDPMKNIIHSIYDRWPDRSCWLFFGCRTTKDIFYLDEYLELKKKHPNFNVIYALSDPLEPGETWDGDTGFIHLSCDKYLEAGRKRQAFLCGPPPMIEAVMKLLEEKQIPKSEVFYDEF